MTATLEFKITAEAPSTRLDLFLASRVRELTRSGIKRLLTEGRVLVNKRPVKAGYKVREGDLVTLSLPEAEPGSLAPEEIPVEVLYEDDDVIVVNKPAGLAVHPGAGRPGGTLVNALLFRSGALSTLGGPERPGVVHRLDKDTTGVMVVARNDKSHLNLARQFKEHSTERRYVALVWGRVDLDEGTIDMPIGRDSRQRKKISTRTKKERSAVTGYRVLERYPLMTLLELRLKTGRTHQVRVHLAAINHPVVGDQVYGRRKPPSTVPKPVLDLVAKIKRQLLHAKTLGFTHPSTGERLTFSAPLPPDMERLIETLERS